MAACRQAAAVAAIVLAMCYSGESQRRTRAREAITRASRRPSTRAERGGPRSCSSFNERKRKRFEMPIEPLQHRQPQLLCRRCRRCRRRGAAGPPLPRVRKVGAALLALRPASCRCLAVTAVGAAQLQSGIYTLSIRTAATSCIASGGAHAAPLPCCCTPRALLSSSGAASCAPLLPIGLVLALKLLPLTLLAPRLPDGDELQRRCIRVGTADAAGRVCRPAAGLAAAAGQPCVDKHCGSVYTDTGGGAVS